MVSTVSNARSLTAALGLSCFSLAMCFSAWTLVGSICPDILGQGDTYFPSPSVSSLSAETLDHLSASMAEFCPQSWSVITLKFWKVKYMYCVKVHKLVCLFLFLFRLLSAPSLFSNNVLSNLVQNTLTDIVTHRGNLSTVHHIILKRAWWVSTEPCSCQASHITL